MRNRTLPTIALIASFSLSLFVNANWTTAQEPLFKKYLNSDTDVVGWMDVSRFSIDELEYFKIIVNISDGSGSEAGMRDDLSRLLKKFSSSKTTHIYALGNAAQMVSQGCLVIFETEVPRILEKELKTLPGWSEIKTRVADGHLLAAISDPVLEEATETAAATNPHAVTEHLKEGLKAFGGRAGLVVALKPEFQRMIGSLPGANEDPDKAKIISAIAKLNYGFATQKAKDADWNIQLNFSEEDASQSFCRAADRMFRKSLTIQENLPLLTIDGLRVTLPAENQKDLFARLSHQVTTANTQVSTMNHLRQLTFAVHNFYSAYEKFPPQALSDDKGNKLLSWRVLILPFLGQQALYEQFKLDEPWDSPHNRQLISKMPDIFASADRQRRTEQLKQGVTCFQAPLTKDTIFGRPGELRTFKDITDGTSNTILFVEVTPENAVPWTKPDDWTVDSKNALRGLFDKNEIAIISLADGSVHKINSRFSPERLPDLLTMDGGEVVTYPLDQNENAADEK